MKHKKIVLAIIFFFENPLKSFNLTISVLTFEHHCFLFIFAKQPILVCKKKDTKLITFINKFPIASIYYFFACRFIRSTIS